jgi:Leucine-rich repeat (LRR) protein
MLEDNSITGTIPAEIGKLSGLKKLDLSSNHLYGEIPSSLFYLESLRYM